MINHNINTRYAFEGSDEDDALEVTAYSLVECLGVPYTVDVIMDYESRCQLHGNGCLGHIEEYDGQLLLPIYITPGTADRPHQLMVSKRSYVNGSISYDDYLDNVLSYMRGKSGAVRSVNSIPVQGSLRMVISPWHAHPGSIVSIPIISG
jgi:hypothetical protein